jgi:RHS repeat-associated protein
MTETLNYFVHDHLGSVVEILNEDGSTKEKISYDTWGNSNSPNAMFTGKQRDTTGLYYFNARYYDPIIGRFITEDPAKQGNSWYTYCGNNPLNHTDPDGREYTQEWLDDTYNKYINNEPMFVSERGLWEAQNFNSGARSLAPFEFQQTAIGLAGGMASAAIARNENMTLLKTSFKEFKLNNESIIFSNKVIARSQQGDVGFLKKLGLAQLEILARAFKAPGSKPNLDVALFRAMYGEDFFRKLDGKGNVKIPLNVGFQTFMSGLLLKEDGTVNLGMSNHIGREGVDGKNMEHFALTDFKARPHVAYGWVTNPRYNANDPKSPPYFGGIHWNMKPNFQLDNVFFPGMSLVMESAVNKMIQDKK